MLKPIKKNITLENVKKSDYWNLISILVWNHYSETRFQDESKIEITESWYGKGKSSEAFGKNWDDPNYTEKGYKRTLKAICITFTRSDYVTTIYINNNGNINAFGTYSDKSKKSIPSLTGTQRNLDVTNWMIKNKFVKFKKK